MKKKWSGVVLFVILTSLFGSPSPARQKRVYIANDDHTDYMWTADVDAYRQAFLDMLDYYLGLADQTAANPSDFRSRFNPDGAFWVRVYEQNRTAAEFARLIDRVKDGSISVPLTMLNLCYGAMPAEAVIRSMYYAGRLERKHGLRLKLALAQENQTLPFGLGTLFSAAGASYFWKGICGCASQTPNPWDRPLDMYWWTGLDGSRILTKWNSMIRQNYYDIGGYAEARNPSETIDFVLSSAEFQARHPYDVIGIFGHGGDDLKTQTELFIQTAQAKTNDGVRVVVSNILDFFDDFAASYGAVLPAQSVSFGNEWDILSASMAELSARVKRVTEKLRAAEAMAALVSLRDASFMAGREAFGEQAWVDLGMYYDHDWTADGSVISRDRRADWQRERAAGIESYVTGLFADSRAALGAMIAKDTANARYFVFNPLGWARTGPADLPYSSSGNVHVVDNTTGLEVPSQIVSVAGQSRLRIWAENIPPVGYKTFDIVPGEPSVFAGGPAAAGVVLENSRYRVQAGTNGSIVSLIDKLRGNREMVRPADGRAVNDLGPGGGTIVVDHAGPVSAALRIASSGPLVHETLITLYRDSSRIDIENRINQNFGDIRTWDFALNLDAALLRHEEVGAVLLARLTGDGGAYSPKAARYDWLTLNHFADLSAGGTGLTVSSPDLSFLRRGNSAPSWLDDQSSRISILAGGQVDGPSLGIPNQGGDSAFLQRFGLEIHGEYDAAAAMRFALQHQNPLETGEVTGGTAYPGDLYSLFSVTAPGVFLWAVKPAEDTAGGGIVARLWNQAGSSADFGLQFNGFTVSEASRTTLIETPLEAAAFQAGLVSGTIPGYGWRAYHIKLDRAAVWPEIRLSKTQLGFGAERNGTVPPPESATVTNGGTGSLNWQAAASADWLSVSPAAGSGTGTLTIGVNRTDLPAGAYQGTVSVTDPAAWNSPQTIAVAFHVFEPGTDAPPFGNFETPLDGATVASSIPVTGWALDDIGIGTVKIYRGTGTGDRVYIGDAVLVEGARPDVEAAYPGYPQNSRAGWGYMLLTNFLPLGDGPYTLLAYAVDTTGHEIEIGSKTITVNNASAVKPFGAIDTPEQGGTAAGSAYLDFGWVLTPQPDHVPADGSTIWVWVDGLPLGHPSYGHERADIATLFPGYANSGGAVGYFNLDTTDFADGVHTIAWSAADSGGDEDGIGSRYFMVQNAVPWLGNSSGEGETEGAGFGADGTTFKANVKVKPVGKGMNPSRFEGVGESGGRFQISGKVEPSQTASRRSFEWEMMPEDTRTPVLVRRGSAPGSQAELVVPGPDGALQISIPEVTRVAVYFNEAGAWETVEEMMERGKRMRSRAGDWNTARLSPETSPASIAETVGFGAAGSVKKNESEGNISATAVGESPLDERPSVRYEAYELVLGEMRPIPIGSSFDPVDGILYWQPGPGFLGEFAFVFIDRLLETRKRILIAIG